MKNYKEPLFAGTILSITADTGTDERICMKLKGLQGRYPIIIYEGAVYTQLNKSHRSMTMLAWEILPQELKDPEHEALWAQCCRDWPTADANSLLTETGRPLRLFLHVMNDNSECLVAAEGLEIRQAASGPSMGQMAQA